MRDVLFDLADRVANGETVGVGTVVATFSSAPRPAGAAMLVTQDGEAVGSVSGGCVEGAVYDLAQSTDDPVLQRYGVSDDDAFAVGLTCGGIIDIYVEKINAESFPQLGEVVETVRAEQPVAVATVIEHPEGLGRRMVIWPDRRSGSLGSSRIDDAARA
jgi:xanthine dehydrogenase accessory factor